jgi:LPS-assembly lipoprotein
VSAVGILARLTAAACLALLAGCGFHLQGKADPLPEDLGRVYVSSRDDLTPFAVELRRGLDRSGVEMAASAGEADAVIRVRVDRSSRRVLAVSARNTPTEFELQYVVEYSVDRGGVEAVPAQRLELTRNFSFDQAQLLAKGHEEDILREAMARDLADLVLRRLATL